MIHVSSINFNRCSNKSPKSFFPNKKTTNFSLIYQTGLISLLLCTCCFSSYVNELRQSHALPEHLTRGRGSSYEVTLGEIQIAILVSI